MKTNRLFIMALAVAAAVSCAKETDVPSAPSMTASAFTAEKENFEVASKAVLDGRKSKWEAGDEIAVHADGATAVKFSTAVDGEVAEFTSETAVTGSSFLLAYPYSAAKGVQDGKLLLTVPAEQVAVTGSFDPAAAISAAASADLTQPVKFKNALALLKINVPADLDKKVIKITVEAKGGESLAGDILFDVASKANTLSADGKAAVSLLAAPPMAAGDYYLAVRPCDLPSGVKVTVLLGDKSYYTRESGACEFDVNTIYNMGIIGTTGWSVTTYQYAVSTVSGLGSTGLVDGDPSVAKWSHLGGIHYAPDGESLWILDRGNGAVRRMTLDTYTVSTLSKGTPLNAPWHGAFAPDGSFYIANKGARALAKVDAEGKNPENILTGFGDLIDVDFDASGNLYLLDRTGNGGNTIYKLTGTDVTTKAKFVDLTYGQSMEFDTKGNLIVMTGNNTSIKNELYLIASDGTKTVIAGSGVAGNSDGTPGQPLTANIKVSYDLKIAADGTIYLLDEGNALVRMIVPDAYGSYKHAYVTTIIGAGVAGFADGTGTKAKLNSPYSLCLSSDAKTMWIGDRANFRIRKVDVTTVTEQCGLSGDHQDYAGTDGMTTIF